MRKKIPSPRLKKTNLARKLGISRPSLDSYLNREDAPKCDEAGTFDLQDVTAYINANGTKVVEGSVIKQWKEKKLQLECERIQHWLARERGEYISKAEASETIVPLMAELGALLKQKFEMELPTQYKGRDVVEIAQLNANAVDFIIDRFRVGTARIREVI